MKYSNVMYLLVSSLFISIACALEQAEDVYEDILSPKDNKNMLTDKNKHVMDSEEYNQANDMPKCWMALDTASLFNKLNKIDRDYLKVRQAAQKSLENSKFDDKMLYVLLQSGGAAVRELHKTRQQIHRIPAGLNLGGYCMMRMWDSVVFFHRVKLRNNTVFNINYLKNNLADLTLTLRLSLNDLHLKGAYERCITDKNPSILFYAPSFGQVEFLLKDVKYNAEGRYRLIRNRLVIEVLVSEIIVPKALMTYVNASGDIKPIEIKDENLAEFIDRVKTDLDKWLKDFFNDFLIYCDLKDLDNLDELHKYDLEKTMALDGFMDDTLTRIQRQARVKSATEIKQPQFTIIGTQDFQLKMYDGVFRGLESIYRRSITTGKVNDDSKNVRRVDALVGFTDLKIVYKYEAMVPAGLPPLSGTFILSANDLSAHLGLTLEKDSDIVDIDIDFIDQTRPEFLTVEGSANVLIANFKHVLEHQILSIMTNTLIHGVKMLRELPKCEPNFFSSNKMSYGNLLQLEETPKGYLKGSSEVPEEDYEGDAPVRMKYKRRRTRKQSKDKREINRTN